MDCFSDPLVRFHPGTCIQHIDGHIDDGSTDEAPTIYLDGSPVELTPDQARELAALLLKLALQIEGWVAK